MTPHQAGDVVLVAFPFTDATGAKRRPALVLADLGDADLVVARVTSQQAAAAYDVELRDWRQAGLLLPSIVRIHKVAALEKRLIERRLGRLTGRDWDNVRAQVKQLWNSI